MSDPDRSGPYECCGEQMLHVELLGIHDGKCAVMCVTCGIWRHLFSPSDPRRDQVEQQMAPIIEALWVGSRGSVE